MEVSELMCTTYTKPLGNNFCLTNGTCSIILRSVYNHAIKGALCKGQLAMGISACATISPQTRIHRNKVRSVLKFTVIFRTWLG